MANVKLRMGDLEPQEQAVVTAGFDRHSQEFAAPPFEKKRLNWVAYDGEVLVGALTAELLWDWLYVDELWVNESQRGHGLGTALMKHAEDYARLACLSGLWLWTQSWQAADFYARLGYLEFTRFESFPAGHTRIGFRKCLREAPGLRGSL